MGKRKWKAKKLEKKQQKAQMPNNLKPLTNSSSRPKVPATPNKIEAVDVVIDEGMDSEEEMAAVKKMAVQKNKKKSGGFQSMGLSHGVLKGILRRGYKVPTPIQRKTIPIILEGKDVVAMARTGSGKTAAFLVPMFEKLKTHSSLGTRAIILSPTRELALQTLKFAKEIGKFTGMKAAVVLGGDKMDDQFAALHDNPDIIIATPGRLLHVLVEMEMRLKTVEYVVFDEADRLFEMGFKDQLQEIIHRFADSRQTVLFSATLPKTLVEFARAGLTDPTLIRLDVDTKLNENLQLSFFSCRDADKCALLLYLLKRVIKPTEQTVVFAATKHHVEYLNLLLTMSGLSVTYIYSSLDQAARKINAAKFSLGKVKILLVTDLAARGIDIPLLDNVINFHFPAKPKLFVHRVGRVARAGRSGRAYSFIAHDELAHLIDLHMFLGRPLNLVPLNETVEDKDGCLGEVPQSLLDDKNADVTQLHGESIDLTNLVRVCTNAYKKYIKSRPAPATESTKRVKKMVEEGVKLGIHPMFKSEHIEEQGARLNLLNALKNYKPKTTIFEINSTSKKSGLEVMKAKREQHEHILVTNETFHRKDSSSWSAFFPTPGYDKKNKEEVMEADQGEIDAVFDCVVSSKPKSGGSSAQRGGQGKPKQTQPDVVDKENYVQYRPSDFASEKGYSISNTFEREAVGAVLDLTNDEGDQVNQKKRKWDRKRKKFVTEATDDVKKKKIKTESGNWISASYKSNRDEQADSSDDDQRNGSGQTKGHHMSGGKFTVTGTKRRNWHTNDKNREVSGKQNKMKFKRGKAGELRNPDQILKDRRKKAKVQNFQKHRQNTRAKGKGKDTMGNRMGNRKGKDTMGNRKGKR
ncbi:unnamed protein product [Candidula unifasciata]|uniref:RNA helicase n=1 Tax=Candidula unifasciata TaxID=100452 RepID=A0A8S4A0S9_9EUPU|nr:unnamed protein product [Candidula unifasciata]